MRKNFTEYYEIRALNEFNNKFEHVCSEIVRNGVSFNKVWEESLLPTIIEGNYRDKDMLLEGLFKGAKRWIKNMINPDHEADQPVTSNRGMDPEGKGVVDWEKDDRERAARKKGQPPPAGMGPSASDTHSQSYGRATSRDPYSPKQRQQLDQAKVQLDIVKKEFMQRMDQLLSHFEAEADSSGNDMLFRVIRSFHGSIKAGVKKWMPPINWTSSEKAAKPFRDFRAGRAPTGPMTRQQKALDRLGVPIDTQPTNRTQQPAPLGQTPADWDKPMSFDTGGASNLPSGTLADRRAAKRQAAIDSQKRTPRADRDSDASAYERPSTPPME